MTFIIPKLSKLSGIRLINSAQAKSNDNDRTKVTANTEGGEWIRSKLMSFVERISPKNISPNLLEVSPNLLEVYYMKLIYLIPSSLRLAIIRLYCIYIGIMQGIWVKKIKGRLHTWRSITFRL
jgi:hypothetical protein